jgi:hypothetical protein
MKNYFYLLVLFTFSGYTQKIIPEISARVDTSNVAVKQVYQLYTKYLNSKPDSIYINPNWNEKEAKEYLKKSNTLRIDRSANVMFNYYKAEEYFRYYIPTILQIDSVATGRYKIRTLFAAECPDNEYKKFTPNIITTLYAVKDTNHVFKLENTIAYHTRKWKTYQYEFITYVVHPDCDFNKKEAAKAVKICKEISKRFNLALKPFKYYLLPNSDEMGKLYNCDYWLSYLGGQTLIPWREIFTSYGTENYTHELVHMLFPLPEDSVYNPMIVNEGLATWLAGPGLNEGFEEALAIVSQSLQKYPSVSLKDIQSFKVRNEFDNNILYVTGGLICKLVYDQHGEKGIWKLYNSNEQNFDKILEELFNLSYEEVDKLIINQLKSYATQHGKK